MDPEVSKAWMQRRFCHCGTSVGGPAATPPTFHSELQDVEADGWKQLLELVEIAAAGGAREFAPLRDMSLEARSHLVTLPSTIGKLKAVRNFELYGSCLVRIPPEIGDMVSLEEFTPYTSMALHWYPYEITRCAKLVKTVVSTRALYGNYKYRPPFSQLSAAPEGGLDLTNLPPARYGSTSISECSVCRASIAGPGWQQVWLSLNVGTDVLPLLVNACSPGCIARLPPAADGYVSSPHTGGLSVTQPPAYYAGPMR